MFGLGLPEILIILVVALLVVGPSKLPELARSIGRAFGEFRRMADDVKETIQEEAALEDLEKSLAKVTEEEVSTAPQGAEQSEASEVLTAPQGEILLDVQEKTPEDRSSLEMQADNSVSQETEKDQPGAGSPVKGVNEAGKVS